MSAEIIELRPGLTHTRTPVRRSLPSWLGDAVRRSPVVVVRRRTLAARERNAFELGVDAGRGFLR